MQNSLDHLLDDDHGSSSDDGSYVSTIRNTPVCLQDVDGNTTETSTPSPDQSPRGMTRAQSIWDLRLILHSAASKNGETLLEHPPSKYDQLPLGDELSDNQTHDTQANDHGLSNICKESDTGPPERMTKEEVVEQVPEVVVNDSPENASRRSQSRRSSGSIPFTGSRRSSINESPGNASKWLSRRSSESITFTGSGSRRSSIADMSSGKNILSTSMVRRSSITALSKYTKFKLKI